MCDSVVGEQEVVVKSLGALLAGVRGYLGAAVLGDGRVALILDPAHLSRRLTGDPAATHGHAVTGVSRRGKYLLLHTDATADAPSGSGSVSRSTAVR